MRNLQRVEWISEERGLTGILVTRLCRMPSAAKLQELVQSVFTGAVDGEPLTVANMRAARARERVAAMDAWLHPREMGK